MLNNWTGMGRLCADPELKQTPNGVSVTTFTLAVERDYASQGQEKKTDFVRCVAWRGTAEFISRYFSKGKLMAVTGSWESREYEKQGIKMTAWEVIVSNAYFGGDKSNAGNGGNSSFAPVIDDDEDLPF